MQRSVCCSLSPDRKICSAHLCSFSHMGFVALACIIRFGLILLWTRNAPEFRHAQPVGTIVALPCSPDYTITRQGLIFGKHRSERRAARPASLRALGIMVKRYFLDVTKLGVTLAALASAQSSPMLLIVVVFILK